MYMIGIWHINQDFLIFLRFDTNPIQSNPYFVLSSTLAHDESGMVLNKVPQLMDQFFIQFATQIISFLQTQICVGFTPPHISGLSNGHKNLQSYPTEKYIHRSM